MSQLKGSVILMQLSLMIFLLSILLSFVIVESKGKNEYIQYIAPIFSSLPVTNPFYLSKMITAQLTLISGAKMQEPLMQGMAVPQM